VIERSCVALRGLVPGIYVLCRAKTKTWIAATSTAKTNESGNVVQKAKRMHRHPVQA
jgi:hypothetical protein